LNNLHQLPENAKVIDKKVMRLLQILALKRWSNVQKETGKMIVRLANFVTVPQTVFDLLPKYIHIVQNDAELNNINSHVQLSATTGTKRKSETINIGKLNLNKRQKH